MVLICIHPVSVHSLLKSAFNTVAIEKEKIKEILCDQGQSEQSVQITALRKSLSQVTSCLQLLPMMPFSLYLLGLGTRAISHI